MDLLLFVESFVEWSMFGIIIFAFICVSILIIWSKRKRNMSPLGVIPSIIFDTSLALFALTIISFMLHYIYISTV